MNFDKSFSYDDLIKTSDFSSEGEENSEKAYILNRNNFGEEFLNI